MVQTSVVELLRLSSTRHGRKTRQDRSPIGVTIRVWGWGDDRMDMAEGLLADVRDIVAEGYFFGLELHDIEDDVVENTRGVFADADLSPKEGGEFELTLLPSEMTDDCRR